MSQHDNMVYVIVVLIALLGVLLSCCGGLLGGFVAGWWQASQVSSSIVRSLAATPPPYPLPTPRSLETPPAGPMVPPGFWESGYSAGAMVLEVKPAGPAQKAGLRVGDIIVEVSGKTLASGDMLADLIGQKRPDDQVELKFWRDNRVRSVRVKLGENPDKAGQPYLGVLYMPVPQPSDESD